jgi:hypothetical protein
MNFEISKNICEICRQKATAGILDETQQIKIRYSCQDHYLQVYKKIKDQRKELNNNYKNSLPITESFQIDSEETPTNRYI